MKSSSTKLILSLSYRICTFCVVLYIYLYYSLISYDESVVTTSSSVSSTESEKDSIQKIQRLVSTTTPDKAYLDSLFIPSDGTANFIQNLETWQITRVFPVLFLLIQPKMVV